MDTNESQLTATSWITFVTLLHSETGAFFAPTDSAKIGTKLGESAVASFNAFEPSIAILSPALTDHDDAQIKGTIMMCLKMLGVLQVELHARGLINEF
jgi:hypothetical protein